MTLTRRAALLGLPLSLAGCGIDDWFGSNKAKLKGKREEILGSRSGLVPDKDARAVTVPPPVAVPAWTESGGVATHVLGNIAIAGLKPAWTADIGEGGGYRAKLTAQPIMLNNVVYTMDSDGVVCAFDFATGHRRWRTETQGEKDRSTNIGGGIAIENGTIYATTGRADALALEAATGKITWRKSIGSPARSGPTLAGGHMHFTTLDNQLLALSMTDGSRAWTYAAGDPTSTTMLSDAAPAISDGLVIAGFGSGELVTVRAESGALAWSDTLASSEGRNGNVDLAAIRALPVIDRGRVFAIGVGGLLVSLDLRSGRRLWEREIGGGQTPWLAGDWLFVQTSAQSLAAISVDDGHIRWLQDLPRWDNPAKESDPLFWAGPIMAGGKLILAGTSSIAVSIDPVSGHILGTQTMSDAVQVSPLAVAGTLLVLSDDATLQAFR